MACRQDAHARLSRPHQLRKANSLQPGVIVVYNRYHFSVMRSPRNLTDVTDVCTDCYARGLPAMTNTVPPHSDIIAKRQVRAAFIAGLRQRCRQMYPLVFIVDHCPRATRAAAAPVCTRQHRRIVSCGPQDRSMHLAEDILSALPDLYTPEQIYSANINPRVVHALQGLGIAAVSCSCACLFLQRYSGIVRRLGGFAAAMPDVWGGFDCGAHRVVTLMLREKMLADAGALVMFNACDRYERVQRRGMIRIRDGVYCTGFTCVLHMYAYTRASRSLRIRVAARWFGNTAEHLPAEFRVFHSDVCLVAEGEQKDGFTKKKNHVKMGHPAECPEAYGACMQTFVTWCAANRIAVAMNNS